MLDIVCLKQKTAYELRISDWRSDVCSSDRDPEGTEELACRQSSTILTTDGFWNGNTPSSIGDADGSTGPTITSPSSQPYTYSPVLPYADGGAQATSYDDPNCARGSLRKKTSNPPLYADRKSTRPNSSH